MVISWICTLPSHHLLPIAVGIKSLTRCPSQNWTVEKWVSCLSFGGSQAWAEGMLVDFDKCSSALNAGSANEHTFYITEPVLKEDGVNKE